MSNYFSIELYGLDEKEYRKRVSKIMAVANKRIARLEKNKLQDSPAFKTYIGEQGFKFSVKGKSHNELQKEVAKLKKFMEAETSTVRGVNKVLKNMAKNTGLVFKDMADLRSQSSKFFELASKVEQYLRNVSDIASAIGYQKIWTAINQYVATEKVDLKESENDIDSLTKEVTNLLIMRKNGNLITHKEFDDFTKFWSIE